MQNFLNALTSTDKSADLPEEFDYFGKLVGSWKIDYVDNGSGRSIEGEWHFSRVLEGMAVQDVIILPGYECGTTVRVFNPGTCTWDVAYCFVGKIIRLEARKQNDMVVLTNIDDKRRKWIFAKIENNRFHWQDVTVTERGDCRVHFDIFAERIS